MTGRPVLTAVIALILAGGALLSVVRLVVSDSAERALKPGDRLPEFAAPLASGLLAGDANVAQPVAAGASPTAGGSSARGACAVRLRGSITSCSAARGRLAMLFWFTRGARCEEEVDQFDRVARRFPEVRAVSVSVGSSRAATSRIARDRGWRLPAAVDPDGALAQLYRVSGCPAYFFARRGRVDSIHLGSLSEVELGERLGGLNAPPRGAPTTSTTSGPDDG